MCNLEFFLPFILFNKFYMCINFCYKLIFLNKYIKYNQVNDTFYNIKYLNLHSFFNFSGFFFIVNDYF